MSASFLITLREGLEVSLVLAILLGYLVKTGRSADTGAVWLGTGVAAAACVAAGLAVHLVTDELTGRAEMAVEGTMALLACTVLTWMVLWMHRNARTMGGQLRARVDAATTSVAVAAIAFVATAREGFETALFLLGAETSGASGASVVVGGLLGLVVAAAIGVAVYRLGARVDLRAFFRWTGVLLVLFAAGLAGKAVHEFRELLGLEGGLLFEPLWTITSGPFAEGTTYDFLKGLLGWSSSPERLRVATYLAYLVPVLWAFLRPERHRDGSTSEPTVRESTPVGA